MRRALCFPTYYSTEKFRPSSDRKSNIVPYSTELVDELISGETAQDGCQMFQSKCYTPMKTALKQRSDR